MGTERKLDQGEKGDADGNVTGSETEEDAMTTDGHDDAFSQILMGLIPPSISAA